VAWRYVFRRGKWTKPPINPNATEADQSDAASVSDPVTWGTFDQALAYLNRYPAMSGGVGIVLVGDDDLSGIDLDDCITDSGSYTPLAAEIVSDYRETYAERSPSGNGLRLFVRGKAKRTLKLDGVGVEVYNDGRYLTVTGDQVEDTPTAILPAPRTLARLEAERPPEPRPKANGANGQAATGGDDFFRNVNAAALARLDDWVPVLHPTARKYPNGAWRVTSQDLGRDLEEDLSYYPDGIRDYGEEIRLTATDAVLKYGAARDPVDAARWLCQQMGVEPAGLGYRQADNSYTSDTAGDDRQRPNGRAAAEQPKIPTEADLADRFVERHGDVLRYVAVWSKWLHYDGTVWRDERTHLVRNYAKRMCREAAGKANTKDLRSLASAKTIAAVQTLAQGNRRIAATVEQWDADPWLLNTPAGMIDLRTGELRPPMPDDHCTKITGIAPADTADCPQWLAFLNRIFKEYTELIAYLQRALGYSLTGVTKEQKMWFGFGDGGNGKSVLFDTVAGVMGDYHTTAPIETFTASQGDRHPTEVADLAGARMVTALETEQGRAWAEARIKALTGSDRVKARFMRQDFFEFRPQFKLWIAGNHKPTLRTVDEAIRRRFNMVPFEVTIPPDERDPDLADKLKAEWPAILRWMLDGCRAWQEVGLKPATAIVDATDSYLEAQDALAAWLEQCCEVKSTFTDTSSRLYGSWKAWAERNGEEPGSQKVFAPLLEKKGFRRYRKKAERGYMGLRVIPNVPLPSWSDRDTE
jgi:putative DNA primase/helicase